MNNVVTMLRNLSVEDISDALFTEAAEKWLATRRHHIAPRTYVDYGNYIRTLTVVFGDRRIREITGDDLRAYQRKRMAKAGPSSINKECSVLLQVRARIGDPIIDYQPLPMPKDYESPGRALTQIEEEKLERVFKAASESPTLKTAALASLLSMKSGVGPGEIKSLRLKDVNMKPPLLVIPRAGAKRERRERIVHLNPTAAWALDKLISRAHGECKCTLPEHYLIPRRNRGHGYDPTKPVQAWRGALETLFDIAGVKVRPYDFRHHAVSRALQDPRVSLEAAKAHFGWVSPKMIRRYYHADTEALKMVAAAVDGTRAASREQVLSNHDVIAMLKSGLQADIVVEMIKASAFCAFDVTPQSLIELKSLGEIPAAVLKEMVKANRKGR